MLKADILKSALKGAPGCSKEVLWRVLWILEPSGCSVRVLFILFPHIEHP